MRKNLIETIKNNRKKAAIIGLSTAIVAGGAAGGIVYANEIEAEEKAKAQVEQPIQESAQTKTNQQQGQRQQAQQSQAQAQQSQTQAQQSQTQAQQTQEQPSQSNESYSNDNGSYASGLDDEYTREAIRNQDQKNDEMLNNMDFNSNQSTQGDTRTDEQAARESAQRTDRGWE